MSMNLGELRNEIVSNHGNISGKSALIKTLLNLVFEDLADQYEWQDLQTVDSSLSLGTNDYFVTLPASLQFFHDPVWLLDSDGNWHEVNVRTREVFRDLDDGSGTPVPDATAALPTDCVVVGRDIYFNAKADKTYTIYLDAGTYVTAMQTAADLPSISNLDALVIAYGTGQLYLHRKQPEVAATWMQMADYFLKQKVKANKPGRITAKSKNRPKLGI